MNNNVLESHLELIEKSIMDFVPSAGKSYDIIEEAMKYSLETGGKRVRPMLVLEFCRICGGDIDKALPFAAAVEFIHTYSLIHDDLPCMDNDDMRRGKPSSHIKFGEADALLAGDALLTHAFSALASAQLSAKQIVDAVRTLSEYAGVNGMIGGQIIDLEGENKNLSIDDLFLMDKLKTAALITSACVLGCIAADNYDNIPSAVRFAENLGIAFQIVDDILDYLEGEDNSDIVSGKSTYVSLLGLEKARTEAEKYTDAALDALKSVEGDTTVLVDFSIKLLKRNV
ncbi:MAG: polyprenyl synthetase family protein [Clostridia bacterium]|nr:polyprenyl synthetase family protein [Clostridia bacterium]